MPAHYFLHQVYAFSQSLSRAKRKNACNTAMRELHANGSALNLSHGFQHISMPIEKFILHKRQFKQKRFTIQNSPTIKNQKQFIIVPALRIGVS
jgi:hypothetical protein